MTYPYPKVQFVAAPEPDAAVRFDFNAAGTWADDRTWPKHDGFSLGVPTLEGDPDAVGVEYGLRQLTFNVMVEANHATAQSIMSKLARELLRRTSWLRFQLSEFSAPVWFQTYRTAPSELDFENVKSTKDGTRNVWGIGVTLDAEPFALGARVDLAPVVVNNNPAAATNPLSWVLPPVVGDAPAPMRARVTAGVDFPAAARWLLSLLALEAGEAYQKVQAWQIGTGDAWTALSDTTAPVASAAYSGGSYRATAGTTAVASTARLEARGTLPAIRAGRYRVFLRFARSGTAEQFRFHLTDLDAPATATPPVARFTRATGTTDGHATYADLGDWTFPTGIPSEEIDGTVAGLNLALWVERTAGTGTANLDCLVLIPVDVHAQVAATTLQGDRLADSNLLDAEKEFVIRWPGNGPAPVPALKGRLPELQPGAVNVLTFLTQTNLETPVPAVQDRDDITDTTTFTVSYHPRWLYLADG